jgi:CDP-paratose 2-epimerase
MRILITGSSGPIGSELVRHFDREAALVVGLDNNMRADFFGPEGDTLWNLERLRQSTRNVLHRPADIRDRSALGAIVREDGPFDLVVHFATQPSHDPKFRRDYPD